MSAELRDAIARGDLDTVDRCAEALGGGRAVLRALLEEVPRERRDAVEALLPARGSGSRLDVGALARLGPEGLWIASEWALETIAGRERRAPSPPHEQWDALVEVHRARPEAPWLPIELLASLSSEQRSLGERIAIGLVRRFGERARRIARARLTIGGVALADVLERVAWAGEPRV